MLKKRLGLEAIEMNWASISLSIKDFFKVPTTLVIPEGCEKVGNYAFYECEEMKKVIIPESVEEIGYGAFDGCEEATIILKKPEKDFEKIGWSAFSGCKDVKEEIWN